MKAESIEFVLNALGGDGAYNRSGGHLMSNCVHAEWGHHSGRDKDHKLGVLVTEGKSPLNCFYPGCLPDGSRTMLGLVQIVGGKLVGAQRMTPDELSNLKAFVLMAEDDDAIEPAWGTAAAKPRDVIPQAIVEVCNGVAPYWESRGVSAAVAAEWKLGQDHWRAHLPFLNRKGDMVAVQGRLLPGVQADAYPWDQRAHDEKYRSFPVGFERAELLVGEHRISKPVDWLLVVESPFDAIALSEWLRTDEPAQTWAVVATMGGEVATAQAQHIVDFLAADGELVLGMDTDFAGRAATRNLHGYDRNFQRHQLYRRVARITEVEWLRKDPTDTGDAVNPVTAAQLRRDALAAIHAREDSLTKRLRAMVE